jgi:cytochrome c-type biogenesis protein CcmE
MLHTTLGKVIITGILLLGGGGFLVYSSLDDAQYYEMVDKVVASPDKYVDKDLKLHGYVVAGSIDEQNAPTRTFALEMNGKHIDIRFTGPKPDNLKDRAEVVAHGKLLARADGQLVLEATELLAKCPSKYQGAQSNKNVF